jgi:hypothetical protein
MMVVDDQRESAEGEEMTTLNGQDKSLLWRKKERKGRIGCARQGEQGWSESTAE